MFQRQREAGECSFILCCLPQDLVVANILVGHPTDISQDFPVEAGKWYIIDFQQSLQLDLSPGTQATVILPKHTQVPKPNDVTSLDPYAWDVHCLGWTYETSCVVWQQITVVSARTAHT